MGGLCSPLHLAYRRNSETPGTIDINGENAIIRLEANVKEREHVIPEKRLKTGVQTWVLKEEKTLRNPRSKY
jgi:hypothetical protein